MKNLGKMDLASLEALLVDIDGKFEAKVVEQDKKYAELKSLNNEYKDVARQADEASGPTVHMKDVMARCKKAADMHSTLGLDVRRIYESMLPIRMTIIAKKHPV